MTASTAGPGPTRSVSPGETDRPERRSRDAARTRQLLVDAAFRRFARDGYAATTVRDIADDAGVNVALISRYFRSKDGLFEACLADAVDELRRIAGTVSGFSQISEAIVRQGTLSEGRPHDVVLLLLRSSGDPQAETMRIGLLRTFSEHLASTAGWRPGDAGGDELLLRAQLLLALTIGMTVLRVSPGLEPLASAQAHDLAEPVRDLVNALLAGDRTRT